MNHISCYFVCQSSTVPLGMPYYGNWIICTYSGLMAYASDFVILLHYQVACACSAV